VLPLPIATGIPVGWHRRQPKTGAKLFPAFGGLASGELEHGMAEGFLDELLHRILTGGIEERSHHPDVADVALENGDCDL